MPTKTIPFDAAEHFITKESQVDLLSDALDTGDASYIANALGIIARARGMTKVARGAGVTRESLYKSLSHDGDPKLTTLLGVLKSLGFKLTAETASKRKPTKSLRRQRVYRIAS